jgi:hypothetical protein
MSKAACGPGNDSSQYVALNTHRPSGGTEATITCHTYRIDRASDHRHVSLFMLPLELILMVIAHLSPKDIHFLYCVCPKTHGAVASLLRDTLKKQALTYLVGGKQPVLHWAASQNRIDLVSHLLNSGVPPDQLCHHRLPTAIHVAAAKGHDVVVRLLLDKGADVDGISFRRPVLVAAEQGRKSTVELLLDRGAILNGPTSRFEHSPPVLLVSGLHGHAEIVRMLLERGADPLMHGSSGCSILFLIMAAKFRHTDDRVLALMMRKVWQLKGHHHWAKGDMEAVYNLAVKMGKPQFLAIVAQWMVKEWGRDYMSLRGYIAHRISLKSDA